MFRYRDDGSVEVLAKTGRKEHGLGAYLSPYDPNSEEVQLGNRQHVTDIWEYLISRAIGRSVGKPGFFRKPVMCRVTLSTWNSYRLFECFNGRCKHDEHTLKPWREQVKPFNFAMSPVIHAKSISGIAKLARKRGSVASPMEPVKSMRLIAGYEPNADKWLDIEYSDSNNNGRKYKVTTSPMEGSDVNHSAIVRVKTWGEFVEEFDIHPEVKYCDDTGVMCSEETRGILQRHKITIGRVEYIGKESNRLSDKDEPLPDFAPYEIPEYGSLRDDVRELVLPVLRSHGLSSQKVGATDHGLSERKVSAALGESHAHASVERFLSRANLTDIDRSDVRRLRDSLIMLAVRMAVKDLRNEPDFDRSWLMRSVQRESCWDILVSWKGWNGHG
jgi:hypothetical protein